MKLEIIQGWTNEIILYLEKYVGTSPFLFIYFICLMICCLYEKRIRNLIVFPSVIITFVIFNPILYGVIWKKLTTYAFWRMFWMIPVVPVIGCTVLNIDKIVKNKACIIFASCFTFIILFFKGNNVYSQDNMFESVNNAYKVPDSTVNLVTSLLQFGESIRIVAPPNQYCYIRQYSGDVQLVFGRNAEGFIQIFDNRPEWRELITLVSNNTGDGNRLKQLAELFSVEIIVLPSNHSFIGIEELKCEDIDIEGYILYKMN